MTKCVFFGGSNESSSNFAKPSMRANTAFGNETAAGDPRRKIDHILMSENVSEIFAVFNELGQHTVLHGRWP